METVANATQVLVSHVKDFVASEYADWFTKVVARAVVNAVDAFRTCSRALKSLVSASTSSSYVDAEAASGTTADIAAPVVVPPPSRELPCIRDLLSGAFARVWAEWLTLPNVWQVVLKWGVRPVVVAYVGILASPWDVRQLRRALSSTVETGRIFVTLTCGAGRLVVIVISACVAAYATTLIDSYGRYVLHTTRTSTAAQEERAERERRQKEAREEMLNGGRQFSYLELEDATEKWSPALKKGGGGQGAVYQAVLHGIYVAVKVVFFEETPSVKPDAIDTEVQVLRQLRRLRHPNIVPVYGWAREGPFECIVFKFYPAGDLRKQLLSDRHRSATHLLRVFIDVASALAALHGNTNYEHRDVKPENILIYFDAGGMRGVLADFGIARWIVPGSSVSHTDTQKGDIGYMPPEACEGTIIPGKFDVYSFGATMAEILTGRKASEAIAALARDDTDNRPGHGVVSDTWVGAEKEAPKLVELSRMCTHVKPSRRPTSTYVENTLRRIGDRLLRGPLAVPVHSVAGVGGAARAAGGAGGGGD